MLPEVRNRDVVDRLKAGAALKLFVFALQLVPQSLFDSVKERFIVGEQSPHHRLDWVGLKRKLGFPVLISIRGLFRSRGAILV